ncbi:type III secretion protein [Burkholderia sp. SCN-KJ]|uniref:type III secretion protein n=1 Tax=Burkholderia sp. SCN-KJ TaxID=2969248 RepID=UPI00214FAA02|nr:type III secretion protein [Burkholderia sp. SCN-KJ]MCR4468320.1 type III secretion protein [Burkholderia sp. SCN-KJ]
MSASTSTTGRRIKALKRASDRRERMETELRAALDARRRERVELQAHVDEATARVAELDAIAVHHRGRIAGLMTGEEPFSITVFDGCRRYLEVVDAQVRDARMELDARRDAVASKDEEIAAARRAIAQNRGRIDVCRERTKQLEQALDQVALDAEDEAAEELALARRTLA